MTTMTETRQGPRWTLHDREMTFEVGVEEDGVHLHAYGLPGFIDPRPATPRPYRMDSPRFRIGADSARTLRDVLSRFIDRTAAGEPMDRERRGRWQLRDRDWIVTLSEWDDGLTIVALDTNAPILMPYLICKERFGKRTKAISIASHACCIDPDSARALRDLLAESVTGRKEA